MLRMSDWVTAWLCLLRPTALWHHDGARGWLQGVEGLRGAARRGDTIVHCAVLTEQRDERP